MKTAMQQLLEVLEKNAKNIQPMDIDDIIRLIELDYIELEKQKIINAHTEGYIIGGGNGELYDCKDYYDKLINK